VQELEPPALARQAAAPVVSKQLESARERFSEPQQAGLQPASGLPLEPVELPQVWLRLEPLAEALQAG
jgi:hypothetical protein